MPSTYVLGSGYEEWVGGVSFICAQTAITAGVYIYFARTRCHTRFFQMNFECDQFWLCLMFSRFSLHITGEEASTASCVDCDRCAELLLTNLRLNLNSSNTFVFFDKTSYRGVFQHTNTNLLGSSQQILVHHGPTQAERRWTAEPTARNRDVPPLA